MDDGTGEPVGLKELPRPPPSYGNAAAPERLMDAGARESMAREYVKKFFSLWDGDWPRENAESFFGRDLTKESAPAGSDRPGRARGLLRAVAATANTSTRLPPSREPLFSDPDAAGEGQPSDRARSGAPLAKAKTASVFSASAPAPSRGSGRKTPRLSAKRSPTSARRPVAVVTGDFATPYPKGDGGLIAPPRDETGGLFAVVALAAEGETADFPIALTRHSAAPSAEKLMGTPRGRGGLNDWRDCSSTPRDLLAPFGPPPERDAARQRRAVRVPIGLKGHVGPHPGTEKNGAPVMSHNRRGVARLSDADPDLSGRVLAERTARRAAKRLSAGGAYARDASRSVPSPAGQNPREPLAVSRSFATIEAQGGISAADHTTGRKTSWKKERTPSR